MRDADERLLQEVNMLTTKSQTPNMPYGNILTPKADLKIGSWNVRTMNQTDRETGKK